MYLTVAIVSYLFFLPLTWVALIQNEIHRLDNFKKLFSTVILISSVLIYIQYFAAGPERGGAVNGVFALLSPFLVIFEVWLILPLIFKNITNHENLITAFCGSYTMHFLAAFRLIALNMYYDIS